MLAVIRVKCNDIDQILMHQAVVGRIDRHIPNVIFVREHDPRLNIISSLARMFVGLPFVPALVALAIVTARRIFTLLAAHLGRFDALVNVIAGLAIGQQFIARVALAIEASRRIHAFVPALIQFDPGALVYVAMQRFIALVGAVWFFVAYQLRVDTVTVRAHEILRIRARCVLSSGR